jgi:hypothetical protein
MAAFRRAVVVALLAIWVFPAVGAARAETAAPAPPLAPATWAPRGGAQATRETAELGARERQAQDLQDWSGGEGVFFYVGSGLLLVLIVVLLLVII